MGVRRTTAFEEDKEETGRALKLEIEPGTFLLANAGTRGTSVQDKVHTGTMNHTP